MTTGIFIGRFQPFHNGHLAVIKEMFETVDEVIVCIGSAQEHDTETNPLHVADRHNMIEYALMDKLTTVQPYKIISVSDNESDDEWTAHICSFLETHDIIYTGNEHVASLFKNKGMKIIKLDRIKGISGTDIRKRMKTGAEWEHLVPKQVAGYIR